MGFGRNVRGRGGGKGGLLCTSTTPTSPPLAARGAGRGVVADVLHRSAPPRSGQSQGLGQGGGSCRALTPPSRAAGAGLCSAWRRRHGLDGHGGSVRPGRHVLAVPPRARALQVRAACAGRREEDSQWVHLDLARPPPSAGTRRRWGGAWRSCCCTCSTRASGPRAASTTPSTSTGAGPSLRRLHPAATARCSSRSRRLTARASSSMTRTTAGSAARGRATRSRCAWHPLRAI